MTLPSALLFTVERPANEKSSQAAQSEHGCALPEVAEGNPYLVQPAKSISREQSVKCCADDVQLELTVSMPYQQVILARQGVDVWQRLLQDLQFPHAVSKSMETCRKS